MFPLSVLHIITQYDPSLYLLQNGALWVQFLHRFQYGRTTKGVDILIRHSLLVPITTILDPRDTKEDNDGGIVRAQDIVESKHSLLTCDIYGRSIYAPTALMHKEVNSNDDYINHTFVLLPYIGLTILPSIKQYALQRAIEQTGTYMINISYRMGKKLDISFGTAFVRPLSKDDIKEWTGVSSIQELFGHSYYLFTLRKNGTFYNVIYRRYCYLAQEPISNVLYGVPFQIVTMEHPNRKLQQYLANTAICWFLSNGCLETLWTSSLTTYVPSLFTEIYDTIVKEPSKQNMPVKIISEENFLF